MAAVNNEPYVTVGKPHVSMRMEVLEDDDAVTVVKHY